MVENWITKKLVKRFNGVIVKSESMASVLECKDIRIISNGVDLKTFRPMSKQDCKKRLGLLEKTSYVIFAGDPARKVKNWKLANESVELARNRVSGGLELLPLVSIPPDLVPVYMNAGELLLLTSFSEGSPNVVKESLACNTPVVSVDVGDVSDLLEDLDGCAIVPYSSDKIADVIASVLNSGEHSVEGRNRLVEKSLELSSVAEEIVSYYEEIIRKTELKGMLK